MTETADSTTYKMVDLAMRNWRQGDVAQVRIFSHFADLRRPVTSASIRVRLFERWVISGCFGHAARLRRSMVSSS